MCRAEVTLNRRLAPELYVGVRSLVPVPGGERLRLGDEDDPAAVDFAVEMRRYGEHDTLAARLAAGTAGRDTIAALGATLARFQAAAEPHGGESVKRAIDDDFATLRSLAGDVAGRAAVARAERFAAAFLTRAWDELDARAARGRVRDGHGDLRLEHVLLERGIEIVDSYRAAGGDPGGDDLLAFFAAYRAQVRAKVALTRARQLAADGCPDERERARVTAPGTRSACRTRAWTSCEQLREAEPLDELTAAVHLPLRSDGPVDAVLAALSDALDRRLVDRG